MINRKSQLMSLFQFFIKTNNIPGSNGMKIGIIPYQQNTTFMKKSLGKFISASFKKIRLQKERFKKLRFSNHQEDFVITEQEEREGGFFGSLNLKIASSLKIN